jgi:pimeloyl-CoA dehydrogenase small subunit
MDFEISDEQRLLADSLERMLLEHYDFSSRKAYLEAAVGWNQEQWRRYADMGLLALPFAQSDGGFGGGAVEMRIVMEAFGRALALEPYWATVVLGGGFLRLGGSDRQRSSLIPRIVNGQLLLAFAQAERQSRYDLADITTTAVHEGGGWRLTGRKCHVVHGDCADMLVTTARVDGDRRDRHGVGLFLVDAHAQGLSRRGYRTQDRLRAADVTFEDVWVEADAAIGEPGAALPLVDQVVDGAIAALCAEAVGVMSRAHEITVDYLKARTQFGRPIGSFQVLQHRAVDMLLMIEQARGMAMYAAAMVAEPDAVERRKAMSAAKVQIGRAGRFVGEQAIQLHGGIGLTEEYQVGHFYRRLSINGLLFGDVGHHLSLLASSGGLT